jgi:flagellar protein FlaF
MGFSVSGSAAIIFVGLFLGFGMFYTATTNSMEVVTEAQDDQTDDRLEQANTKINVTSATWASGQLTVDVTNNGTTTLEISEVDVLADNTYLTEATTDIGGDTGTDVWLPGEELTVTTTELGSSPTQVKVITGPGVAGTEVV